MGSKSYHKTKKFIKASSVYSTCAYIKAEPVVLIYIKANFAKGGFAYTLIVNKPCYYCNNAVYYDGLHFDWLVFLV